MPSQQRARRDQAMMAQPGRQQPGQCGQDRTVGPVKPGPGNLAAQDRDLMAEDHDLSILRRLATAQQVQPAKDPDHDQVQEAKGHEP
jgi:hypothetical protein